MQRFTEIKAWQKSHTLALNIYRCTKEFPTEEKYGLVSQMRRAAVSVPANIAEGSKRRTNQDYARFLNVAEASLAELEYLIILARDLGYPNMTDSVSAQANEVATMLHALRMKVET